MVTTDFILIAIFSLTVLSGTGATVLVLKRDDRPGSGRKAVALKFAQIALLGAGAIAAMLGVGK